MANLERPGRNPKEILWNPETLNSYEPSSEQRERNNTLKRLVSNLERARARYSIVGGYGLDGLYGRFTRDHDDIDVLSTPDDVEKVRKIVQAAGFHLDIIRIRGPVELFVHSRNNLKLDLATTEHLLGYTDRDATDFLPMETNASIEGIAFRVPTLSGYEEFFRIQRQRAEEGQWGPYKHAAWKDAVVRAIKERVHEKRRA